MITIPCSCGRALELPDDSAGMKVSCPWCAREISVPGSAPTVDEPAAPSEPVPSEDMVELTTMGQAEAQALVGSLNAAGIPAIAWERDAIYFGGASGAEVKVRPQDLAAARALLGASGAVRGVSARFRRLVLILAVALTLILIFVLSRS